METSTEILQDWKYTYEMNPLCLIWVYPRHSKIHQADIAYPYLILYYLQWEGSETLLDAHQWSMDKGSVVWLCEIYGTTSQGCFTAEFPLIYILHFNKYQDPDALEITNTPLCWKLSGN